MVKKYILQYDSDNMITHSSDTISMIQQGPECKLRNEFLVHHIICGIAIYVTMKEMGIHQVGF